MRVPGWSKLGIPTRLLAVSALVLMAWGALAVWLAARYELHEANESLNDLLAAQVDFLVPELTERAVVGDYDAIERLLERRAQREHVALVEWVDPQGARIRERGADSADRVPAWFAAWAALPDYQARRDISVGGIAYGSVRVQLDPSGKLVEQWAVLCDVIMLVGGGIAALLVAILLVIRRSLRPLEALKRAARELASGDYAHRLTASGAPEMRSVAESFNRMAETLAQSHASLSESEARWQFALEGAGDGVWDWDVPSGKVFFSPQWRAMLGYPDDEVAETLLAWQHLVHPDDLTAAMDAMFQHLNGRTGLYRSEHRLRCRDGSYRWFLDRGKVVARDADGVALRVIGTHTDVTERREAEAQLRRHRDHLQELVHEQTADLRHAKDLAELASQTKSQFLANMSHELRTPMHAVLAYARLGQTRAADEVMQDYFARIRGSGERLLVLINDLLDLSRLESGKMSYEFDEIELQSLARAISEELEPLLANKGLALKLVPHHGPLMVNGDATRLAQVMRNVVANAIRFSPAAGRIEVAFAQLDDGGCEFTVSDQGMGIPEAELEAIFDKFVQSSKTRTSAGGTGLGLAICAEIVSAHGGRIFATNRAAGGAQFHVQLPATGQRDSTLRQAGER